SPQELSIAGAGGGARWPRRGPARPARRPGCRPRRDHAVVTLALRQSPAKQRLWHKAFDKRSLTMRPRKLAAAALLIVLSSSAGWACDSYYDDMSLASVLAQAVSQARANGTLPGDTLPGDTLPGDTLQRAEAKALASRARASEQPTPPAAEGGLGAAV